MWVGCVVTPTIAGRNCAEDSVRELEGESIKRRYVRDAKPSCDHIGTIPDAEEARDVSGARVAFADLARRAFGVTHPA